MRLLGGLLVAATVVVTLCAGSLVALEYFTYKRVQDTFATWNAKAKKEREFTVARR